MCKNSLKVLPAVFLVLLTTSAEAKFCDYRLSELVGTGTAGGVIAGTTAIAASDVAMKAAGFYLITNATTGAMMVGSTAAGASAAGTVGIIGGSAAVGGVVAFITAPVTLTIAALAAAGAAVVEGGCYFADERLTDFDSVMGVMQGVADTTSPEYFELHVPPRGSLSDEDYREFRKSAFIKVKNTDDGWDRYVVSKLYIVNGELRHRGWGPDKRIGHITIAVKR